MIRFEDALDRIRPNTEWLCYGANLEGLTFMDKTIIKPTQNEIDQAVLELEEEALAKKTLAEAKLKAVGLTVDDLRILGI